MNRVTMTAITILALMLLFGLVRPIYLSEKSILTMLRTIAYPGIVTVGVAMCLMGGTMDLSIGAVMGLAAVAAAKLMILGFPVLPAAGISVGIGALVGYVNAMLVIKLKLTTFIATIGTMFVARGIVYAISKGYYIYPMPEIIPQIGEARPLNLSWAFIVFIALLVVFQLALSKTVWGLTVKATGSDREVAFCNEVDVDRVQTQLHMVSSVLAAVAGLFMMCKIGGGQPTIGIGIELVVIAGCAIGGVSLFGYEGSMPAVFLGLLFLQVVVTGVITSGVDVYLQTSVRGIIMLAAMILDAKRNDKIFFRRVV